MLGPSTCWGPAISSSARTGPATSDSSPSRDGWIATAASATGARAWSSPGKATTRAIPPAAVAGRRWRRTGHCVDTSTSTLVTTPASGRCVPRTAEVVLADQVGWLQLAVAVAFIARPASPASVGSGRVCPLPVALASPQDLAASACGEHDFGWHPAGEEAPRTGWVEQVGVVQQL